MTRSRLSPWLALAIGIGTAVPVVAQTPPTSTPGAGISETDDGARTVYEPAFFEQFNAVTAEDILRRIPGIQHLLKGTSTIQQPGEDAERRGFGSTGDQILIDGQRLSGKSNDIATALKNIQAKQVARIEVIHGAVAGLDVRSEGLIVNVLLRQVAGSTSWEALAAHRTAGGVAIGGRLSHADTLAGWKYTAALEAVPFYQLRDRTEELFTPGGILFERQVELDQVDATDYKATLNTSTTTSNGTAINLNGTYEDKTRPETLPTDKFAISGTTSTYLGRDSRTRLEQSDTWEVGGDVDRQFSFGRLRGLFVVNNSDYSAETSFDQTPPIGPTVRALQQFVNQELAEQIVRGSYETGIATNADLEIGSEVAITTLDALVRTLTIQGGILRPVNLFNAQSRIRETRLEPFASLNWQPFEHAFVDLTVEYERSKFKQTGRDVNNLRTLSYLKPRADVRYDIDVLTQIRVGAGRTVSQLDFADFLTSFESDDNLTGVINAGNPNLVPEKVWAYNVTAERRLANDGGLVSVKLHYDDYSDRIEVIPVANGTVSAPGNIGSGRDYGIELKASVRLDDLGVAGGVIEASGIRRKTQTTDPFTGEKRRLRDLPDSLWSVRFRQDFDWRNLSYGVTVEDEGRRDEFEFSFNHAFRRRVDFQAFVELQPIAGLTAKLEGLRILRAGAGRERFTYAGNRGRGNLLRREFRDIQFQRDIKFSLRGVF